MPDQPVHDCPRELPIVLTTTECGDFLGMSAQWVRNAITDGVIVAPGSDTVATGRVFLGAERLQMNGRRVLRVHLDDFIDFLDALGWKRLPARRPSFPTNN